MAGDVAFFGSIIGIAQLGLFYTLINAFLMGQEFFLIFAALPFVALVFIGKYKNALVAFLRVAVFLLIISGTCIVVDLFWLVGSNSWLVSVHLQYFIATLIVSFCSIIAILVKYLLPDKCACRRLSLINETKRRLIVIILTIMSLLCSLLIIISIIIAFIFAEEEPLFFCIAGVYLSFLFSVIFPLALFQRK